MKHIILILIPILIITFNSKKTYDNVDHSFDVEIKESLTQTVDTTSLLIDCINEVVPNSDQKFRFIEQALIENQILKDASPESYRKVFFIHVKSMNIDDVKNTPLVFNQKMTMAEIFRKGQLQELIMSDPPECINEILNSSTYKSSAISQFMNKNNEFDQAMASGEIPEEWNKFTSMEELLNNQFELTLFQNRDVKNMVILGLYAFNHDYTQEDFDMDMRQYHR
ncbi:MAG: hypothetical protein CR968_05480 [Flavobacteriia bacterium]|nr:MAG: hypothetical protein CR968_05480 [Flavobacteriia bacterium]